MNVFFKFLVIIFIITLFSSCSKKEKVTILKEQNLGEQMIELYEEAYREFLDGDTLYAAEKFNEAELLIYINYCLLKLSVNHLHHFQQQ